jgi:hypothetical protein
MLWPMAFPTITGHPSHHSPLRVRAAQRSHFFSPISDAVVEQGHQVPVVLDDLDGLCYLFGRLERDTGQLGTWAPAESRTTEEN